jgi:hypothetical protein
MLQFLDASWVIVQFEATVVTNKGPLTTVLSLVVVSVMTNPAVDVRSQLLPELSPPLLESAMTAIKAREVLLPTAKALGAVTTLKLVENPSVDWRNPPEIIEPGVTPVTIAQ